MQLPGGEAFKPETNVQLLRGGTNEENRIKKMKEIVRGMVSAKYHYGRPHQKKGGELWAKQPKNDSDEMFTLPGATFILAFIPHFRFILRQTIVFISIAFIVVHLQYITQEPLTRGKE